MPDRPDDETRLLNSIMSVPDPEQEIGLQPAFTTMRSERVYHLVNKWQDEGIVEYDRVFYIVRLAKLGRLMREPE